MKRARIERLGRRDYVETWQAMSRFTATRDATSHDRLWIVEHPAVYTLGRNGRREHLLRLDQTPLVETDRGGQVTWHGPGQIVVYPLLDLRRLDLGVRDLVSRLEQAVVDLLAARGIDGRPRRDAPGVYVDGAKIAALGLRITRGCSYHGLSLNVANDLAPFDRIDPCGYRDLAVTRLHDLGCDDPVERVGDELAARLIENIYKAPTGKGSAPSGSRDNPDG